jgi:hypothetical protein
MQKRVIADTGYTIYLGTGLNYGGALKRSTNYGSSWSTLGTFDTRIRCVAVNSGAIVVGILYAWSQCSTDGGANWAEIDVFMSANIKVFNDVFYTVSDSYTSGLWTSSNGTTWTQNNQITANCYDVFVVGTNIYVAGEDGLYISTNSGTSFSKKTTSDGLGSNNVYSVLVAGSTIWVGTAGGVSKSTDGGAYFTNYTTSDGLADNFSYRLEYDTVAGIIYSVKNDQDAGLSYSTNEGITWGYMNLNILIFGAQSLNALAFKNGRIYVAGSGHDDPGNVMGYSDNQGSSWSYITKTTIAAIDEQEVTAGNSIFII